MLYFLFYPMCQPGGRKFFRHYGTHHHPTSLDRHRLYKNIKLQKIKTYKNYQNYKKMLQTYAVKCFSKYVCYHFCKTCFLLITSWWIENYANDDCLLVHDGNTHTRKKWKQCKWCTLPLICHRFCWFCDGSNTCRTGSREWNS